MPSIDLAMERSLGRRRSLLDLVAASLAPMVQKRDVINSSAFSSWSNCMQTDYCKWPAIVVMIIVGLIIFSVLWCIIRCACCGLSCCCSCFSCLRCCGCGCCCDPPRGKLHKYLDAPYVPPDQGYRSEPAMGLPSVGASRFDNEPPKYATYDVTQQGREDALPSMPSPEGESKREMVEDGFELGQMTKPAVVGPGAQAGPLINGLSAPPSPAHSPVGRAAWDAQSGHSGSSGFYPGSNNSGQGYGQGGYGSRGYTQGGAPAGAPTLPILTEQGAFSTAPPSRTQSSHFPNNGWDQTRRSPVSLRQASYDTPSRPALSLPARAVTYDNPAMAGQGAFDGYGQTQGSQGYGMDPRQSPRLMAGGGGYPAPAGRPVNNWSLVPPQGDYGGHPRSPTFSSGTSAQQYWSEPTPPLTRPTPPHLDTRDTEIEPALGSPSNLMNNSGFDFNSGYSRPTTASGYNGNSLLQMDPQQQQQQQPAQHQQGLTGGGGGRGGGYPGMRSYQPASPRGQVRSGR